MKDQDTLKVGDTLICTEPDGLRSPGDQITIIGLTEKSINVNGCKTCWQSRESFRWRCYRLKQEVTQVN